MEPQVTPETASPVARPVMDVRPPRPVAPLGSAPPPAPINSVSEAPVSTPASSPTLQPVSVKQAPAEENSSDGAEAAPSNQKPEAGLQTKTVAASKSAGRNPHTPLGLISATVIVMVGLAAAAVAVYVNSQPGF